MTNSVFVHIANPSVPHISRSLSTCESGNTIWETLIEKGFVSNEDGDLKRIGYFIVILNGKAILQAEWNTIVSESDVLQVQSLPMGGGGGSNVVTILVTIVAVAAAVFTGGASLGVAVAWGAAAGAAVGLLSSMIPTAQTSASTTDREAASSTYSINSQQNSARIQEAIPVQYGRMRVYPDLASQPYTENRGNEVYLYQLMCITMGEIEIEKFQIEDSDFSAYGEIEYQLVKPGEKVTLFPDNVVTSEAVSGLEMKGPNEDDYSVLGPFVTSPAGSVSNYIAMDVTFPSGAYDIDQKKGNMRSATASYRFEAQLINDSGTAIGSWFVLAEPSETFATQTAQMLSYKVAVPEGRYQVRAYRTNNVSDSNSVKSTVQWTALKAYIVSEQDYGNVTLLAVVIKATNNLNSNTARRINVIGTRLIPTWDPVNGWSDPVKTSNPAWVFADVIRNSDYSMGLATSRLNMSELYRLAQVWATRGDEFNGVFDTTQTLWAALQTVGMVGRATPVYYAGTIDLVRDEPKTIPSQIITPALIKKNTFKNSYKIGTSQTPDVVEVEYFDRDTWATDTVECYLPGSNRSNKTKIQLIGCTNRDHAWREGMYAAAVNRDQRRRISWSMELDGLLPKFGDLVWLSHDLPQWGYSGRVISFNPSTGKIVTSEPLPFTEGEAHQIAFRKKNGKADGPYSVVKDPSPVEGVNSAIVVANGSNLSAIYISSGINSDLTQYQFGRTDKIAQPVVVLSSKPSSNGDVSITGTNYATSPHVAENGGDVPPPVPISDLPSVSVGPIVNSVTVVDTVVIGQQQIVATPANGAVYYEFQVRKSGDSWQTVASDPNPFIYVNLAAGQWQVRVRAIGSIPGPWATWSGQVNESVLPVPTIASFSATTDLLWAIRLGWSFSDDAETLAEYAQIYYSLTNDLGTAIKLIDIPYPATTYTLDQLDAGQAYFFWIRLVDKAKRVSPWFKNDPTRGVASTDNDKLFDALTDKVNESLLTQSLRDQIAKIDSIEDQIKDLTNTLEYDYAAHATGDIVRFNNKLWQAITDVPADDDKSGEYAPPNSTYWLNVGEIIQTANGLAGRLTTVEANVSDLEDDLSANVTRTDKLFAQITPDVIGDDGWSIGQTTVTAGQVTVQSVAADATSAVSKRVDTFSASIASNTASIQEEVSARTTAMNALAARTTTLEAKVGDGLDELRASVQVNTQAIADIKGTASATYAVKLNLAQNGKYYFAGFGINLATDGNTVTSEFTILADRFAIMTGTAADSASQLAFVVENNSVYLRKAFMKSADIADLIVGTTIRSSAYTQDGKYPIFSIDMTNGDMVIRNYAASGSYIQANRNGFFLISGGVTLAEMSF